MRLNCVIGLTAILSDIPLKWDLGTIVFGDVRPSFRPSILYPYPLVGFFNVMSIPFKNSWCKIVYLPIAGGADPAKNLQK